MKTATHELSDSGSAGRRALWPRNAFTGKVVTFGGGYALWRDGLLIGGLGISGGSVEQDMDIALAAIAAINVRNSSMNTSELETLIRTILSEQLTTPAQTPIQPQGKEDFPVRQRGHRRRAPGVLTLSAVPLKTRSAIISAIRQELTPLLTALAEESANETGMGNKEDKYLKTRLRWTTPPAWKISPPPR